MTDLPLAPLLGLPGLTIEVLEIGAQPEGGARHERLGATGMTRVTVVDPAAENTADHLARGVDRVVPVLLGDGMPGRLHVTRYAGFSSLLEPDPAMTGLYSAYVSGEPGDFQVMFASEVQTARLDDVLPDLAPDLIRLDIQGGELAALAHGPAALDHAAVVEARVGLAPLYKDQPLLGELQVFLRGRGFLLHKLLDVAGRSFMPLSPPNKFEPLSQLLWADAVFVRDFGHLEAQGDDQLLKGAVILNDAYHSYDLALRLLAEHDRRHGGGLAGLYHQALLAAPSLHPEYLTLTIRT